MKLKRIYNIDWFDSDDIYDIALDINKEELFEYFDVDRNYHENKYFTIEF